MMTKGFITIIVLFILNPSDGPGDVQIGNQVWMASNLNVTTFRNGDPIQEVKTDDDWYMAGHNYEPAWCHYDNDPANDKKYGKLYNWYAFNDPRGLAPEGWHMPSGENWAQLVIDLGSVDVAWKRMKSENGWPENGNGNNASGFNAYPAGRYNYDGFKGSGYTSYWWSTEVVKSDTGRAWGRSLSAFDKTIRKSGDHKAACFSVRCIKD